MFRKILILFLLLLSQNQLIAQQFIGLTHTDYSSVHEIPNNPAWVNTSETGMEFHLFSANVLAGTNAYHFKRSYVLSGFSGVASEYDDPAFRKDWSRHMKHLWLNIDMLGPAASFTFKTKNEKVHHVGIYTRVRQLARGGNLSSSEFQIINDTPNNTLLLNKPLEFNKAGFSTQRFAEIGFTYGKLLMNDEFQVLRVGGTIKYVMGLAAASIYTKRFDYVRTSEDTIGKLNGDLTALYTYNANAYLSGNVSNMFSGLFDRAGRASLGLDLGAQYEYHPNGNPNEETPYLFSIAASITDLGSVKYFTDTGSATYNLTVNNKSKFALDKKSTESVDEYILRLKADTVLTQKTKQTTFRMGLPTAFRLNIDYNVVQNFSMGINMLLNLRGNSDIVYRPAYVNYFNLTPTYGNRYIKFSLPFTYIGYQTLSIGAIAHLGPFYVGSSSLISSMIIAKSIRNIDAYFGFSYKFKKERQYYR